MDTPAASAVAVIWAVGSAPAVIWAAALAEAISAVPAGALGRGGAGQHFAGPRGHLDHGRRFGRGLRFGPGWYDYGFSYDYPYYVPCRCYLPED